jgi:hypothetical protein
MGVLTGLGFVILYLATGRTLSDYSFVLFVLLPAIAFLGLFAFRNKVMRFAISRFQFTTIYWAERAIGWLGGIGLLFFILATLLLVLTYPLKVFSPSLNTLVIWGLAVVVVGVFHNLRTFATCLSQEARACLCLEQALTAVQYDDSLDWLSRGIDNLVNFLKNFRVEVPSRMLKFAINSKLLQGESIFPLVTRMWKAALESTARKRISDSQSGDLLVVLRGLIAETERMKQSGFNVAPSYYDRGTALWDSLSKSATVITALVYLSSIVVILWLYSKTGQLLTTSMP